MSYISLKIYLFIYFNWRIITLRYCDGPSGGPGRAAIFAPCSQAPRWTCYEKEGFLEVENASLFLKKQGVRVVVKKGRKYLHSWMKIDVNEEGKPVNESLCSKKGEFFLSELILKVLLNILLFCI